MNNSIIKKVFLTTALAFGASQSSFANHESSIKYVYKGDDSARSICLSIAKNNVNSLNRALDHQKINRFDRNVHERFECNGMNLHAFARSMQSTQVANHLAPRFGFESNLKIVASE